MKKIGEYWMPDVDVRWGKARRKSKEAFENGRRGKQIHHLHEALSHVENLAVAVDAGANIGNFTRDMAERFDHVHAFEPAPDTVACLKRNVQEWGLADKVTIYPNAVSNKVEKVQMKAGFFRRSISRHVVPGGDVESIIIDSLDLQNVTFFKIDVEGYEENALKGSLETLKRCKPIIMMEVKPHQNARFGEAMAPHNILEELGYELITKIGAKEIDWLYRHPSVQS